MTYSKLKIYGERNTGTNYLERLLKTNLKTDVLPGVAPLSIQLLELLSPGRENLREWYFKRTFDQNFGWKHRCVDLTVLEKNEALAGRIGFLCLLKNPYSWLLSFYKRTHHYEHLKHESFEDFLQTPISLLPRDNIANHKLTPVKIWNLKNSSYLELSKNSHHTKILKYESLIKDPKQTIDEIAFRFKVSRKSESFINVVKSTKSKSNKNFYDYQKYYNEEIWKQNLTTRSIHLINSELDQPLVNTLGYRLS
ncbi:MAG: sulfotransferase domain-containing protein [Cyclobacteriaceae bacterium]